MKIQFLHLAAQTARLCTFLTHSVLLQINILFFTNDSTLNILQCADRIDLQTANNELERPRPPNKIIKLITVRSPY